MFEQLLLHIERHQLCKTTDKILLAVSGGVDSMVMFDLFRKAGFLVSVAHCNFQLRGADSTADEELVAQICNLSNTPFFLSRFNTADFASEHGLSIQVAARQLRYNFFGQVCDENGYTHIATAHHLNDSIETTILNFARGTGGQGLSGIPVKNGRIIRPLLFATREQIVRYARDNKLEWREDESNADDDYQRNFIRHKITPLLDELNPSFESTFQKNIERISGAAEMTRLFLENFRATSVQTKNEHEVISFRELKQLKYAQVVLWELLKAKGFNYDQCCDVVATVQPGKQFLSPTHRLIVDRENFIVSKRDQNEIFEVLIERQQERVCNGLNELRISTSADPNNTSDPMVAQLDSAKIIFPLRWRKWRAGDSFRPLGMSGHKKVSDLLIDLKISVAEKEQVTVLESAGKIVWVVGVRISEDAKISASTTALLTFKLVKTEVEKIS